MNLPLKITPAALGASIERLATGVAAGWNREHRPDGTHELPWVAVPFSAALYEASAGTWTVPSTGQLVVLSRMVGRTMSLQLEVQSSSVSTTPTYLAYRLPNGKTATRRQGGAAVVRDNGTMRPAWWLVEAGRTSVRIYLDLSGATTYAASASNTSVVADMQFEVR